MPILPRRIAHPPPSGTRNGIHPVTLDELKKLFPNASQQFLHANSNATPPPKVSPTVIERDVEDEPLASEQGKGKSIGRVEVRLIRRSTKILDVDNAYGSCKWLCDALRFEGVIRDDDPESIHLIVSQEKVHTRKEVGVEVIITPIP